MRRIILSILFIIGLCNTAFAVNDTKDCIYDNDVVVSSCSKNMGRFEAGQGTFLLNGKPFVVKAAELHYPRIPKPYWDQRIKLCKALGMNTICLYVFWNAHEPRPGEFDFTGQNDLAEFCRFCQQNGMYVILRPDSYVCAEWEMGGSPGGYLKRKTFACVNRILIC